MVILVGLRSEFLHGFEWTRASPAGTMKSPNSSSPSGAGFTILSAAALADQRLAFPGVRPARRRVELKRGTLSPGGLGCCHGVLIRHSEPGRGPLDAGLTEFPRYHLKSLRQQMFTFAMHLPYWQGVLLYL